MAKNLNNMKFILKSIIIIFLLSITLKSYAQQQIVAVPYKVANPTENFPIETGHEYAKLVSLAAAISKDITICNPKIVEQAFKKLSLNSQRIITEKDLITIGEMGKAEYVLIGTLSRVKKDYISESILYSMREKKITSKSRNSYGNLFKLAEEDMKDVFFNFSNSQRILSDKQVDATLMLDLSYKTATEWDSIKKGVEEFSDAVSENWSVDTQINIIPFSDKYTALNKYIGLKSASSIQEKLNQIKPAGANTPKSFENAMIFSVKNIPWRRSSEKILIIISNSEKIEGKLYDQYALTAKNKRISVFTISLGLLKDDAAELLRQFAVVSSGQYYAAAYRQRCYNEKGEPVDLFYQGERIFHSLTYDNAWKNGLFEVNLKKISKLEKPKSFLNEIYYSEKKYNINPYNLSKHYPLLLKANIINTDQLENNIAQIMLKIGEAQVHSFAKTKHKKSIAKVQISDGRMSMWIRIKEDKDFAVIKNYESGGSFPLGVIIKRSPGEPYGIILHPDYYVTEYSDDYIPNLMKTNLTNVIKNPGYYESTGLLIPPVWFLDVKVEKIEKLRRDYDIREIER